MQHTPKSKSNDTNGAQQPFSRSSSVLSSPQKTNRMQKDRSFRIIERQTLRGQVNERCPSKLSDLEASFVQLQDDLKRTKDHANSSDFQKRRISVISAKLKETNQQLSDISSSEDDRIQELCKISKERDKAWALELEAVRKHHLLDMVALNSAKAEIQKLKKQLEMVTNSEAVQTKRAEFAEEKVRKLQFELRETLTLAEISKAEARHRRVSDVQAQEVQSETQSMLETVSLSSSASDDVAESLDSPLVEMEQSVDCAENEKDADQLKDEIRQLKLQVSELRTELDTAEARYREEYLQSTLQIRNAYELVEVTKSEFRIREAELVAEIKRLKLDSAELEANQKNGNESARSSDEENILALELTKARALLLEKGNLLQEIAEENEKMKLRLQKAETEKTAVAKHAAALAEARKISDSKVMYLTQEAGENSRRVSQALEQLEAAQAAKIEIEMELKRQKVQCDQWRKAAETAAAMINTESGKFLDRSESLDSSYRANGSHIGSEPYSEDDDDDDASKRRNGSMLKKMGVLWRKGNQSMKQT